MNAIVVAPPRPLALEIGGGFQVGDDPLNRPLGNPDLRRDIAELGSRVAGDQQQHVGVVTQERPPLGGR